MWRMATRLDNTELNQTISFFEEANFKLLDLIKSYFLDQNSKPNCPKNLFYFLSWFKPENNLKKRRNIKRNQEVYSIKKKLKRKSWNFKFSLK